MVIFSSPSELFDQICGSASPTPEQWYGCHASSGISIDDKKDAIAGYPSLTKRNNVRNVWLNAMLCMPALSSTDWQTIALHRNDNLLILCSSTRTWTGFNMELKWSGGWSTGTVGWLSASERGHDLEGWPAMNTKCLVPLPFLPDLILWSSENRSHGSPVLVPPETQ